MAGTRWPLIWMYHSVDEYRSDPHLLTVRPRRFEQQLAWLHGHGLRGVSIAELAEARRHGPAADLVGLTFDDGYRDFLHQAVPVLARYGYTATVYVLSGRLGGSNEWDRPGPVKPLMTADDVRQAAAAGMEIGSHGVRHVSLPELDVGGLRDEVVRSRKELADVIGAPVTGFAYPYGAVGEREVDAVRDAGYTHAVAVRTHPYAGRHALPRTYIGERDRSWRLRARQLRQRLREPAREVTFT